MSNLPTDAKARKALPLFSGCFAYFPDALLAVAEVSRVGNDQHNPGQPLHWAKEKSRDEADALLRHLIDHGTIDTDGIRHSAKVAWRALALLQREIDRENGYEYDPVLDAWRKQDGWCGEHARRDTCPPDPCGRPDCESAVPPATERRLDGVWSVTGSVPA